MKIHIVQEGDTLWQLAQQYGVDFEELQNVNQHIGDPDNILPGMKVKIPSAAVQPKKDKTKPAKPKASKKKEEVKPDVKKPGKKPEMKKPDKKPDVKKPDLKSDKKPDLKMPDLKSDKKPDVKKPDLKSDKKPDLEMPDLKPDKKPDLKMPDIKPDQKKPKIDLDDMKKWIQDVAPSVLKKLIEEVKPEVIHQIEVDVQMNLQKQHMNIHYAPQYPQMPAPPVAPIQPEEKPKVLPEQKKPIAPVKPPLQPRPPIKKTMPKCKPCPPPKHVQFQHMMPCPPGVRPPAFQPTPYAAHHYNGNAYAQPYMHSPNGMEMYHSFSNQAMHGHQGMANHPYYTPTQHYRSYYSNPRVNGGVDSEQNNEPNNTDSTE